MRAAVSLFPVLAAEGLRHAFAASRSMAGSCPPDAAQSSVVLVEAAQPLGAACMADGHARATGRFGVCLAADAAQAAAMAPAAAAARADASPVLFISASPDLAASLANGPSLLAPAMAASYIVEDPRRLQGRLRAALTRMLAGAQGPTLLGLPADGTPDAPGDGAWTPLDEAVYRPRYADAAAVERLWRVLVPEGGDFTPTRLAVLAGAGVERDGAVRRLIAFAEQFEIPVATTARGKGAFPGDHRLHLGVFGPGGHDPAAGALLSPRLETLVVLGCGLPEEDGPDWERLAAPSRRLVQVDADPGVIGRSFGVDVPVAGDCRTALTLMLEGGSARINRLRAGNQARAAWLRQLRGEVPGRPEPADPAGDEAAPSPPAVAEALRRALSRDGCLVVDPGPVRQVFTRAFTVYRPQAYFTASEVAPAGWAVAAAVGVRLALPQRPVACVTDVSGMLSLGAEVVTAARLGLPVLFVVLGQGSPAACGVDFAALGRSLGARGLTVARAGELDAALAEGLAGPGPCLAQVRCAAPASPGLPQGVDAAPASG
ncbi:thiamine pyrophosphate-dependent enzyme [Solidesulfovibrio sp.]|uniref:thiamine pyrophosphate-dependent enzyme n=1 Tax=Solidesulfovibrio sp. TaxID=2910990 RepID=UPI002629016C|nr:thiamine pyrophosphate-dependent enzyme [Solidesulfovibrio sp.]